MSESIYLSEEVAMLKDQLRRFIESEITPAGEAWEEAGAIPREVIRRMGELGFLGIRYPETYGGAGLDTLATAVLAEECGRSTFGGFSATVLVHTDMASPHLARNGSAEQLEKYMAPVVAGETVMAIAVTEPDAGSDVAAIRTRAEKDGNGWVLNGSKMFITNGVHAGLTVVAAKTDRQAKGSRGISLFLVEKGTSGFRAARALDKQGWRSSDTAELVFEDCRLPADALLGDENRGFYAIMQNFQNERLVLGSMAMGEARKAIELTLEHVQNRKAFGEPLWRREAIRQRLARRAAEVEAGRQLVRHAAWLDARGRDCVKEVSMVKAYCGELVNRTTYDCLQFFGGMGYMRESPIERMARDARVQAIGGGATEVMLEEVAKRM